MKVLQQICSTNLSLPRETFVFNVIKSHHTTQVGSEDNAHQFVASASNDALQFLSFDATIPTITSGRATPKVHAGISSLLRFRNDGPLKQSERPSFATAGRDGVIKLWRDPVGEPYHVLKTPNRQGVSALAISDDDQYLAVGTELESDGPGDVAIFIWDLGADSSQPFRAYLDSHNDTLTSLSFHTLPDSSLPQPRTYLLSASTDGLISVIDPSIADEDEALVVVFNNKAAVNHVELFTTAAGIPMLCVLSQDEKMTLHEIGDLAEAKIEDKLEEEQEASQWPIEDLREQLGCDYAVTLRSQGRQGGLILVVGAYREETLARNLSLKGKPTVDVYISAPAPALAAPDNGFLSTFKLALRLSGSHGEEIVRDIWIEDNYPFVVTCGEDGHVRVWAESATVAATVAAHAQRSIDTGSAETQDEEMAGTEDAPGSSRTAEKKKRRRKHKNKDKDLEMGIDQTRYRPY